METHPDFSLEFVQAVNDWQRGYDAKQKRARINQLRAVVATVNPRFRIATQPCYRQVALRPNYVWEMGTRYRVQESVSAWTEQYEVAQHFKGGVAPKGMDLLTVIFRISPTPDQVVLNLATLYADPAFRESCELYRPDILGFGGGIAKYAGTQHEVILEVADVQLSDVFATGGHSSDAEVLLHRPEARRALKDLRVVARMRAVNRVRTGNAGLGPRWMTGPARDRILDKWVANAVRLQAREQHRTRDGA